jgi:membrane protease YdiL (CAAX protease family)
MLDVLFYACMILIFAASVPIWRHILKRAAGKRSIVEPRQRLSSPIGLVDLGALLFVWLMSQIFAGVLFTQIADVQLSDFESLSGGNMTLLMLIAGLAQLIACAIGLAWLVARYHDARVIGWYPKQLFADLKLASASFLIVAPIVLVAQTLLALLVEYKHPAMEAMVEGANWFTIVAVWISAVIAAPIAEEVVFRGWIQNWLQRLSFRPGAFAKSIAGGWWHDTDTSSLQSATAQGSIDKQTSEDSIDDQWSTTSQNNPALSQLDEKVPETAPDPVNPFTSPVSPDARQRSSDNSTVTRNNWIAIILTSLIFAMMHLGQGLAPIPLFGLSILLGYLYQRTGSLAPCIGLHMLNNGYSVFWLTMQILFGELPDLP